MREWVLHNATLHRQRCEHTAVVDRPRERGILSIICRAAILPLLMLLLLVAASLSSTSAGSDCLLSAISRASLALDQGELGDWLTYWSCEYEFRIRYPSEFRVASTPSAHIVRGAVVTFVSACDPSIEGTGTRTNLFEFSVTIGVTNPPVPPHLRGSPCAASALTIGLDGQHVGTGVPFAKHYSAEGAVGNRYEKVCYFTDCGDQRYEISLFMHTGNPSFYEPGSITVFDSNVLIDLFERMVHTFLPAG